MTQLREFARHKKEFKERGVGIAAISVDDRRHALRVWKKVVDREFPILTDPNANVIRKYGLLHATGHEGEDIAIRATLLIDEQGRERWRRVSETVADVPSVSEILRQIPAVR